MLQTAFGKSSPFSYLYKWLLFPCLGLVFFSLQFSCKTASRRNQESLQQKVLDSVMLIYNEPLPFYHPAPKKTMNLVHTRLYIQPDWISSSVNGKAEITATPHFYDCDSLILDAQAFQIKNLYFKTKKNPEKGVYTYDQKQIRIKLNKMYHRGDTLTVVIEYTAQPLGKEGNYEEAITSDKGLFFINPLNSNPYIPKQFWSQGETVYNSKWFPTIEANNQKMTQEIFLKVDKNITTLSNGLLIETKTNSDGTKTDYWKQSLPSAPYLTMIAGGNFSIVKDQWKGKEISYYVEPGYERYAKLIFGKTPKMMSFFSEKTGIPYPWEKYAQIAVRDYVSGAMENTTATVHAEDIQRTERELLEETGEDIISHELFHHWFGNYVTCESWSNLPLNESFATYGEYLWLEHEYGNEKAESHRLGDLENYLSEAKTKQVSLIRPFYVSEEEMFDAHSYAKGGLILHHLRKYIGDEAFFTTLNLYLKKHAFGNAEVEDLRMAFEEVTGEDLNWFFDQWFKMPGHPDLEINYDYADSNKTVRVTIDQLQDADGSSLFKLPATIDLVFADRRESHKVWINEQSNHFYFKTGKAPLFVMVDGEQNIPCTRVIHQSEKAWIDQYYQGKSFTARLEAISNLNPKMKETSLSEDAIKCLTKAVNDPQETIRLMAISGWELLIEKKPAQGKAIFLNLAQNDASPAVRRIALESLNKHFKKEEWLWQVNLTGLEDRAYSVQSAALANLYEIDPVLAFERAKRLEADSNRTLVKTIAEIYAQSGTDNEAHFFEKNCKKNQGFDQYDLVNYYGKYLLGRSEEVISRGVNIIGEIAQKNKVWFVRLNAMNQLGSIEEMFTEREKELKSKTKTENKKEEEALQKKLNDIAEEKTKINAMMSRIKKEEKNPNLIKLYNP